ncbi:cysteine protease ATG4B-like isoform X1 [Dreissena polymorpha]|uniref:cysteine protease ATG4B-like isoform X1 n=1 Tax=Dreissena polymorpha TaxID=45954 RepID=UPI0022643769|nr:cysteine protease ATG4B-like isoform X1 [Dreissena polymorpha]
MAYFEDPISDGIFAATFTYESGPLSYTDFPHTDEPVFILGEQYSVLYDLAEIRDDVTSRLWFTYRRGFPNIGGTGPSCDTGWGCMLRCGQMMLAQALVNRHLGRGWRWHSSSSKDERYRRILEMFMDKKSSYFSIHQIASMGVSEGKTVGQWFGPNTVAQVLKKLVVYDEWSSLAVHVAMDNSVIMDDIKCLCKCKHGDDLGKCSIRQGSKRHQAGQRRQDRDYISFTTSSDTSSSALNSPPEHSPRSVDLGTWKPLLLFIPLRLGLTDTNVVYVESLKKCLSLKQSIGMIGGKPNHAHWFIGYMGDELVYLDPHTTQMVVEADDINISDESYHCQYSSRMKILDLDPSIALGFYCSTEADFEDLCGDLRQFVTNRQTSAMFELHKERPLHWPPYEPYTLKATANPKEYDVVDKPACDSDDDFEIVDY